MKPNLLNDILHEGSYPEFRDELCVLFRSQARRRQYQKLMMVTLLAASIVIVATLLFLAGPRNSRVALRNEHVPTIRSAPLLAEQLLVTKPTQVDVIESRATVMTFTTRANLDLQSIDDSQLLALFLDRPAGLVQTSTGEHLVFIDRADREKFMGSN
jgi:hypothetical protein